jgi:uncharacterized Zn finger protein
VSRENIDTKGRRLLTEGRVQIVEVGPLAISALVRGDSGEVYTTGWVGDWACTCEARGRCSHLVALQLVTTAPKPTGGTFPTGPTEEVPPF